MAKFKFWILLTILLLYFEESHWNYFGTNFTHLLIGLSIPLYKNYAKIKLILFWFHLEPRNDSELQDENNNAPSKKPLTNKPSFKLTADNPHHLPVKGKSLNSRKIKTILFSEIFLCFLKGYLRYKTILCHKAALDV